MAEQIPDVVLPDENMEEEGLKVSELKRKFEAEDKTEEEEVKADGMRECISQLEQKSNEDKEDCKRFLNAASSVERDDNESLYKDLFGLAVRDCVDSILKREVLYLTMEMTEFRRSISQGIHDDKAKLDQPFDIMALPEAFRKAWQVWRSGDTEDGRAGRADASYKVFTLTIQKKEPEVLYVENF